LVGSRLTNYLNGKGHEVSVLSRKKFRHLHATVFEWNPKENYIEDGALHEVDAIVNLAGAGVADKPWSTERKKVLMDSRINSAKCLFENLKNLNNFPSVIVNASAVGYYGYGHADHLFNEEEDSGADYLAEICVKWEEAANQFLKLDTRLVKLRIGMVLDEKGGALKKIKQPIQLFAGAVLGSGDQMISWIHAEDMYRMIEFTIENKNVSGAYNAESQPSVSNKEFTKTLAEVIKRPLFLPNVPSFVLKMMLGEMSEIVLRGSSVSNEKIKAAGFKFKFEDLKAALVDLL